MFAGADDGTPQNYFSQVLAFAERGFAELVRPPSHSRRAEAARRLSRRSLVILTVGAVIVISFMYALDVLEIGLMPTRGAAFLWPFRLLTDFGKSTYVLVLLGAVLVSVALVAPRLQGISRSVLLGFATRIAFLFFAVGVPVLVGEIIKGLVGRGRPFVGGHANAFNFSHFSWNESYASFPSGHSITCFALAFGVAAVWPRMRTAMLVYAMLIASSRLVLLAHHPSDVLAGALTGIIGAMFVRHWFAARRLGFFIDHNGVVRPLAGPSADHLKRVARDAIAP